MPAPMTEIRSVILCRFPRQFSLWRVPTPRGRFTCGSLRRHGFRETAADRHDRCNPAGLHSTLCAQGLGDDPRFFLPRSILAGALIFSATSDESKAILPGAGLAIGIVMSCGSWKNPPRRCPERETATHGPHSPTHHLGRNCGAFAAVRNSTPGITGAGGSHTIHRRLELFG